MSKSKKTDRQERVPESGGTQSKPLVRVLTSLACIAVVAGIVWVTNHRASRAVTPAKSDPRPAPVKPSATPTTSSNSPAPAAINQPTLQAAPELSTMEVNHAVMVTVELDLGSPMPSIADALHFIDRRYQPDDGKGRTFAILDAYGGATADNKKLHMSMHVSAEKPGLASLIFIKTGEVLWQTKILASTNAHPFTGKDLSIMLDTGTGQGKAWVLDGSGGPSTILDAKVRDLGKPAREIWPDGEERECTFVYSACGCPVKVMVRRTGETTVRTKDMPVMFPDDPAAVAVINKLMGW